MAYQTRVVVIISANIEWQVLLDLIKDVQSETSPLGDWFEWPMTINGRLELVIFFHGGWGKIAAAASAQYAIDRWKPELLVNLGTCGGFAGSVEKGTLILADKTIVYDIVEQMTDANAAIAHFSTDIDLSWLVEPFPQPVLRTLLVSGDRDLMVEEVPSLRDKFGAVAGDWESGATAWVANRNKTRCLILRGVTDLVGANGGEAYDGNLDVFVDGTKEVFTAVLPHLPVWISRGLSAG
jgi:adenosylhomocysteine nucleosidase